MKIWELIKTAKSPYTNWGMKQDKPVVLNHDDKSDDILELLHKQQDMLTTLQSTNASVDIVTPVAPIDDTILNDDEISEVMSYLLELQEKYFSEIPLAPDLCKKFVWNIPKAVYDEFKNRKEYGFPDVCNIMTLFYAFCMDNVDIAFGKFMSKIGSLLDDEEVIHALSNMEEEYDSIMESADDTDVVEEDEE